MYLQSLKLLQPMVKEMHSQENTLFALDLGGQGHMKCCPVPSTSCDLCTSKVCLTVIPGKSVTGVEGNFKSNSLLWGFNVVVFCSLVVPFN